LTARKLINFHLCLTPVLTTDQKVMHHHKDNPVNDVYLLLCSHLLLGMLRLRMAFSAEEANALERAVNVLRTRFRGGSNRLLASLSTLTLSVRLCQAASPP
jgi:hypothetical protein